MLVEINLLPQKRKQSKNFYYLIGIILFLAIIITSLLVWQINVKKAEIAETQQQLDIVLSVIAEKNQQLEEYNSASSVQELKQAIDWAEAKSFDAVFLIEELTKMLPERGFILNFTIDENYKINQVIQFDTKSDAAYYLHTLLSNEWVEEAVISETGIEKEFEEEETEENATPSSRDENILPRYKAQYEILLNLEEFAKAANKEFQEERGEETT